MLNKYQGKTAEISIGGHIRNIHEKHLVNLVTNDVKEFNDIHSYIIECGEVTEQICDIIVSEMYDNFSGQHFSNDKENELFYYVFCNKYLDTNKIPMPNFTRQKILKNSLQVISEFISNKKYDSNHEKMIAFVITQNINKLGFDTRYLTHVYNGELRDSKIISFNIIYVHNIINTLLYHLYLIGIDIYDEFIKYHKITDSEIIYYDLDLDNAPRYRHNEFTNIQINSLRQDQN